ncbi:MAG: diaminopimelate epimerase [Bacteroidales bacterium]|nr:diaminopimelate epimerase [Bacteroidales bacterium]
MKLPFTKYDGAGNDFIAIDMRKLSVDLSPTLVARLCHRRFGIGADGVIALYDANDGYDFEMRYYNSDGYLGTMCGNGGRCIAMFAHTLGLSHRNEHSQPKLTFKASDGPHHATILLWDNATGIGLVELSMHDIERNNIRRCLDGWFLDTGSPHYVQRVENLSEYDVFTHGKELRNNSEEFPEGTNVDFIEDMPDGSLFVRTFERGVEDETWACGTGVTAAAIVSGNGRIKTRGGDFKVTFNTDGKAYTNVHLTGPVSRNFSGEYNNQ